MSKIFSVAFLMYSHGAYSLIYSLQIKGCILSHFFLCAQNQKGKNSTLLRFHLKDKFHLMVKLQLPDLDILYCTDTLLQYSCNTIIIHRANSTFFQSQEKNVFLLRFYRFMTKRNLVATKEFAEFSLICSHLIKIKDFKNLKKKHT